MSEANKTFQQLHNEQEEAREKAKAGAAPTPPETASAPTPPRSPAAPPSRRTRGMTTEDVKPPAQSPE